VKIPNPMPYFGKVRAKVLLKDGTEYNVSAGTERDFEVEDAAVEVIVVSASKTSQIERVWTPERGLQDAEAYFQHKRLTEQVKELEEQKQKMLRDKAKAEKTRKEREKVQVAEDKVDVVKDRVSSERRIELRDRSEDK
jgi:hypothetical protein